jgi:predicted metalloprotease with PDZ domain
MIKYRISYTNPKRQFILVKAQFEAQDEKTLVIHLPSWRPGRYELQHFAKRLRHFEVSSSAGNPLTFHKVGLSSWEIETGGHEQIVVSYEYHAALMDAGNSWLDDEQLYINFVNCMVYSPEERDSPCEVKLDLPDDYEIACGLTQTEKHQLLAPSYNILVDSPMFASKTLRQVTYSIHKQPYHLWFQGDMRKSDETLINDFERFTAKTIEIMGPLPCKDYHFLFQILPYKHYHGVEHWNSTVITIGPAADLDERERYLDFLGVSCHELFHTWNVIRLRPIEMSPYNFLQPNLHLTGFITEGITTYYGDLILARSGVYSVDEYAAEVNKLLKRHFDNDGRKNYSVAESSYDLWLDGYEKGIPGRKVSIYNEGALAALILDLLIRTKFSNQRSLDDVMRTMWERHGADCSGYTWQDYQTAAEEVYESPLASYFDDILFGTVPYESWLFPLLEDFGISIKTVAHEVALERLFGYKSIEDVVTEIATDSPAENTLMLKDRIVDSTKEGDQLHLKIERYGQALTVELSPGRQSYFEVPAIDLTPSTMDNELFTGWLEIKKP